MIWTAWNNGRWHESGAGYGFKVDPADRDKWFSRGWSTVLIELPTEAAPVVVTVNVAKRSFWTASCRELISREIGKWLLSRGYAPWPQGRPPKFHARSSGVARFEVSGVAA